MIPNEINKIDHDSILLVGRDPGEKEEIAARPFVGPAGKTVDMALAEANISRLDCNLTNVCQIRPHKNKFYLHNRDDVEYGVECLRNLVLTLKPNVIVALGNEAAYALIDDWPTRTGDIFGAHGIEDRRGYIYAGYEGYKVIPTVHPSYANRSWVPWRMLLTKDLERAKEERDDGRIIRPTRTVEVVSSVSRASEVVDMLGTYGRLAFDIELYRGTRLACVGVAPDSRRAFVFTPSTFSEVFALLSGSDQREWVGANAQFDVHYLQTRNGVHVRGHIQDTQIAWHSCYPELAGKSDHKSFRVTRKGLGFLASLYTKDEWWKDYEFTEPSERYLLNGRDCCITYDIMSQLDADIDRLGVRHIYEHTISLVPVCVTIQERGFKVDEGLRQDRLKNLNQRFDDVVGIMQPVVVPLLEEVRDRINKFHLFEEKWTCPCCRNGKLKKKECWSCAGLQSKPSKTTLKELGISLSTCAICDGVGQRMSTVFNPRSDEQKKILLFDVLKLPKRYENNKLSVAEDKIKNLLATCEHNERFRKYVSVLEGILEAQKVGTIRSIYERLEPGEDGKIRTVLSGSGTETGRLSSSDTFLEPSTNLQNLPKKTAKLHPFYNVREILVPDDGYVLCEADYSSAERILLAYLAQDSRAISQINNNINSYKWLAAKLYGIDDWSEIEKSDPKYHVGKTCVLALDRGVFWKTLMRSVNKDVDLTGATISAEQAKKAYGLFHRSFPGYKRYFSQVKRELRQTSTQVNVMGRMRTFFARRSSDYEWESLVKEAVSFQAQAIGDILNSRLQVIHDKFDPGLVQVLLQVHDAIIWQSRREDATDAMRAVKQEMEKPVNIGHREITIPVEVSMGENWGNMIEWHSS